MSTQSFAQLGVPDYICRALDRRGITEPFEIQAATIADVMAGRDVCGRAPTGSGKTLAFGIPLVALTDQAEPKRPTSLVLAPTRELAEQITAELRSFSGRIRVDAVYGGVGYGPQLSALRRGVDILVACPGRLEDLIERRDVDLSDVRHVVLDEADRMADMGFMPSVKRLLGQTRSDRQTILFSATLDGDVAKLTRDYQHDPVRHEVGEETPDIKSAEHVFWNVDRLDRIDVTSKVIGAAWPAIVFCRTRHGADRLAKQLGRTGLEAAAIHGGRSQSQRTRALADFSKGRVHALIATDVAARGIHVDGVASVIHFDLPEDQKAYVHRSGRTARAGESGLVVSLVQREQRKDYGRIQRAIGLDVPFTSPDVRELPSATLTTDRELVAAAPARETRSQGQGNRSRNSGSRNSGGSNDGRSNDGRDAGARTDGGGGNRNQRRRHQNGRASGGGGRPSSNGGRPSGNGNRNQRRRNDARRGGPRQRSGR